MKNRIRVMISLLMGLVMSITCMPVQAQIIHPSGKQTYKASEMKPDSKVIWHEDTELIMDIPLSVASIQCDGSLTISGSALLKVKCSSGDAVSALSLECSAPVTIEGSTKASAVSTAEGIELQDSVFTVKGVRDGLTADTGGIVIRNGKVDIDCKGTGLLSNSGGIWVDGDTVIRSGGNSIAAMNGGVSVTADLTAIATNEGSMCIYAKGGGVHFNKKSSFLRSRGTCIWSDDEIIFNTDVDAASSDSDAVRYRGEESYKVIQMNKGNVTLSGNNYAISSNSFFYQLGGTLTCSGGIRATRSIWLEKGETNITCSGDSPALFADDVDVRSQLIIDAEKSGAVAVYTPLCGNVTLESDFVNITAAKNAVVSNGTLSLSGSAVIVSMNGAALVSYENMTIRDGIFMLVGDTCTVYSRKNIMTGSCDLTVNGQMNSAYGSISLGGRVEITSSEASAIEAKNGGILVTGNLKGAAIGKGNHVLDAGFIQFDEGSEVKLDCKAATVYSDDQIISYGNVDVMSKEEAAIYVKGDLKVENGSLHAEGYQDAVYSGGSISLADNMHIRIPADGYVSYHIIRDSHGSNAPEVLINKDISYVTFRSNNGTGDEAVVKVDTGSTMTLPESPFAAPSGKRFAGWDKGMPGTDITVYSDMVINALWEDDLVEVSFFANGGSGSMSSVQVLRGSSYTVPSCRFTAPSGKQFYGWEVNDKYVAFAGTVITITEKSVFKALWQNALPEYYTVTFDANGGSGTMPSLKVHRGDELVLPECSFTPPTDKLFAYWKPSNSAIGVQPGEKIKVNSDVKVMASWKSYPYYRVNFIEAKGDVPPTQHIMEGKCAEEPTVSAAGYVFEGWYTEIEHIHLFDFSTKIYHDTTLYGKWELQVKNVALTNLQVPRYGDPIHNRIDNLEQREYDVVSFEWNEFDLDGKTPCAVPGLFEKDKKYMAVILLKAREGYAFADEPITQFKSIAIDGSLSKIAFAYQIDFKTFCIETVVMPALDAYPRTMTFLRDPLEMEGPFVQYQTAYKEPFTLPECTFTPPEGMVFAGWEIGLPGDVIYPEYDMTIQAVWIPADAETITVDFVTWLETAIPSQIIEVGTCPTKPAKPFRLEYAFTGWYINSACTMEYDFETPLYADTTLYAGWEPKSPGDNGWRRIDGMSYWYEDGIRQGTYEDPNGVLGDGIVRGREIYDPDSDAWYWLDAEMDGAMARNKEVWMPYIIQGDHDPYGKWVRYDDEGHMIKGWYTNEYGTYYYDPAAGAMTRGQAFIDGMYCAFDEITGIGLDGVFLGDYWYEKGVRQGTVNDAYGVMGDGTIRGREIYDPASNAWYWLDAVYEGAVAKDKEVWMPYLYQGEMPGSTEGKWVRYDHEGHMIKGWYLGSYYYDRDTGAMAKGRKIIDGIEYEFDEVTGQLKQQ